MLSKEILDLMVEYYLASYENFDFQAPFDDGPEDLIVISRVTINKFGRCRIGSVNRKTETETEFTETER